MTAIHEFDLSRYHVSVQRSLSRCTADFERPCMAGVWFILALPLSAGDATNCRPVSYINETYCILCVWVDTPSLCCFFQTSSPVWEDFLGKSLKLHAVLRLAGSSIHL